MGAVEGSGEDSYRGFPGLQTNRQHGPCNPYVLLALEHASAEYPENVLELSD